MEPGKDYVVYGLTVYLSHIWYYLVDGMFTYYPVWKPSPLFEVIDRTLSKYWVYGYHPPNEHGKNHPIVSFPEWANDRYFYDRLTDGEEEVQVFRRYRKLMDAEAELG